MLVIYDLEKKKKTLTHRGRGFESADVRQQQSKTGLP
jgi:hypothetical protein